MCKSIDSLAVIVQEQFHLESLFPKVFFCSVENAGTGLDVFIVRRWFSPPIYSIIETAKANALNVYTYLEYLLMYIPDTDWRNDPEDLDYLIPWSEAIQAECKR